MTTIIKSKYNYKIPIVLLVFTVGVFGFIFITSLFDTSKGFQIRGHLSISQVISTIISFSFIIYSFYHFLTYHPSIAIANEGLTLSTIFNSKFIPWTTIGDIKLTGKQPYKFIFSMPMEATTLILKNGSILAIWTDYYRNKSELRQSLEKVYNSLRKNSPVEITIASKIDHDLSTTDLSTTDLDDYCERFDGNHLLSFNGFTFYGVCGAFGYFIMSNGGFIFNNLLLATFVMVILITMYGVSSYQMHYFLVYDNALVIKNTIWFWRRHIYPLSIIREVVIEQPHRSSYSARVITRDFKEKLYPAGSLRDSEWRNFIETLLEKDVNVRDEIFQTSQTSLTGGTNR